MIDCRNPPRSAHWPSCIWRSMEKIMPTGAPKNSQLRTNCARRREATRTILTRGSHRRIHLLADAEPPRCIRLGQVRWIDVILGRAATRIDLHLLLGAPHEFVL